MRKIRIFALFLALVLTASLALASCDTAKETKTAAVETAEADNNDVWDYEVKDLQGHDFLFLCYDTPYSHLNTNEIYAEDLNGDKINDAVYKRNSALQKKFNCTISEERSTSPLNTARDPLMSGEYVWDFIYDRVRQLRSLSTSNLLVDFNTLKSINLDKTWWDQNMRTGLQIKGHLFYVTGDAGTLDDRATWVMYFNRDLMDRNRMEDLYEVTKAGNWTIEKMYEVGQACWSDEDGDGVFSPATGKDIASYMGEPYNNWVHVAACEGRVSILNYGEIGLAGALPQETMDIWAELKPLITDPHRDVSDKGSRFQAGRAAFFGCNLGGILTFADSSINFGVLPFPKRNVEQEKYWTSLGEHLLALYSIPATAANMQGYQKAGFESGTEMAAYFLEAFAYESVNTLTPAFYDQVLRKQAVRDPQSVEMIDLALENRVYDPVVIYNFGTMGTIFGDAGCDGKDGTNATKANAVGTDVNYDTLTSLYNARLEGARKALNNYLNFLDDYDETNI